MCFEPLNNGQQLIFPGDINVKIHLFFLTLMLSIAGCGNAASKDEDAAAGSSEETSKQDKPAEVANKKPITNQVRGEEVEEVVEMHEDRDSQLTTFVFDGSSETAFEAGLKEFQEAAPTEEYRTLKSALQYLLVYDLSARGNKAKLYSNLNGKTAQQIIDGTRN